jgi:hypothetical protein
MLQVSPVWKDTTFFAEEDKKSSCNSKQSYNRNVLTGGGLSEWSAGSRKDAEDTSSMTSPKGVLLQPA